MTDHNDRAQSSAASRVDELNLPAIELAVPWSHWLKRLLAANPFYLLSALLLLFGIYRVSVDPDFLAREIAQLAFNLFSLQVYALLVVVTAILLARRKVWYDSTLLVVLDNLLVVVPLILISQAALIDARVVGALCTAAGAIAVLRTASLKRWVADLNFPPRLAVSGFVLLLANVALPIVYRLLHENKVGKQPTTGAAFFTNEIAWLLLIPILCALASFVPLRGGQTGFRPRSRWLPAGLLALWLTGTGVHLYCLGYVYDFDLRPGLLAPGIWVLAWVGCLRFPEICPETLHGVRRALTALPLLAAFLAAGEPGKVVFLTLTGFNLAIYGVVSFRERGNLVALACLLVSGLIFLGGLPETWEPGPALEFSRWKLVGAGAAAIFLAWASVSRHPGLALLGAIAIAALTLAIPGNLPNRLHCAFEAGLVFFLLHSLRWVDGHTGLGDFLRLACSLAWFGHAAWWNHLSPNGWFTASAGLLVLAVYAWRGWSTGNWAPRFLPVAAVLVLLSRPGNLGVTWACAAPVGLLAVLSSFLLFALGTLTALTKHHWHPAIPPAQASRLESRPDA